VNIEEYISSGILETYAMGELTGQELARAEANLKQYPELRSELAKIEETLEAMMVRLAVSPPAVVKDKLMVTVANHGREVKMDTPVVMLWRYAAAASIIIALGTTYMAYDYHGRWKDSVLALNELIGKNQQIADDYNRVNNRLDKVENDLRVIDNPAFTKVVMKGTPNAPQAMASVYWNEQTKEVFLSIQNLRELSQEQQYQLWAIIDGKPVDAGVFDTGLAGLQKMHTISKGATTFAVTIEPRGGKDAPSLETMQVAGAVTKG
jgi:anti-sigma-K factor RskA